MSALGKADEDDSLSEVDLAAAAPGTPYDEMAAELPFKLMKAAELLKQRVGELPTDEYGDMVFNAADVQNIATQKLVNFGKKLTGLLYNLKGERERKKLAEEEEKK